MCTDCRLYETRFSGGKISNLLQSSRCEGALPQPGVVRFPPEVEMSENMRTASTSPTHPQPNRWATHPPIPTHPQVGDSLKSRPCAFTWKYKPAYPFSLYCKPPPPPKLYPPSEFIVYIYPVQTHGGGFSIVGGRVGALGWGLNGPGTINRSLSCTDDSTAVWHRTARPMSPVSERHL